MGQRLIMDPAPDYPALVREASRISPRFDEKWNTTSCLVPEDIPALLEEAREIVETEADSDWI